MQLNGNLLFERKFGHDNDNDDPYITEFGYQWQAKYRWQPVLEYGLQGFGDMGKWNDWDKQAEQSHRIGPAVSAKSVREPSSHQLQRRLAVRGQRRSAGEYLQDAGRYEL